MNVTLEKLPEAPPARHPEGSSPTLDRRAGDLQAVVRRHRAVSAVRRALARDGTASRDGGGGAAQTHLKTIVVIDDELDQVDLIVTLLRSSGHRAIGSTDGAQAVAMVTGAEAEVVVLDFMMGSMTGGDVCTALRAEPKTREVRIVLLSGTSEGEIRRSCTQYDTYLPKPASSAALFAAIGTP